MKIREFAEIVKGEVIGNAEADITGVSGIKEAGPDDITFISSGQYTKFLKDSRAACIIIKEPIPDCSITQIRVNNPHYAFAKAIECFHPARPHVPGISSLASVPDSVIRGANITVGPFACISEGVVIGDNTVIMPGSFIGEKSRIGSNCLIYPNVTIRENVSIGDRVIIHSGTVIGSDGFGYVFEQNEHYKIPQVGGVIIEDDVEIGSNVSVDRATIGNTLIKKGTKIDNLAQIAHNVSIGERSLVISQVGIAGSTEIGDFVIIGGQAGIADHTTIESGTMIAAQTGLKGDIKKGIYSGSPGIPHAIWLRAQALYAKLPEMNKRIRELEEKIKNLEKEK